MERVTCDGTAMQRMPAAFAARNPAALSSSAVHACGGTSSRDAARR